MAKLLLLGTDFDLVMPPQSGLCWATPAHYTVHMFRTFVDCAARHVGSGGRTR